MNELRRVCNDAGCKPGRRFLDGNNPAPCHDVANSGNEFAAGRASGKMHFESVRLGGVQSSFQIFGYEFFATNAVHAPNPVLKPRSCYISPASRALPNNRANSA